MEPAEFVSLAEAMLREAHSPEVAQAILRTAINRAYLGALMTTALGLTRLTRRIYPRDYTFYQAVEEDLEKELPGFSDKLATLRTYRRDADYDMDSDVPRGKSEYTVRLAQTYIADIREKLG